MKDCEDEEIGTPRLRAAYPGAPDAVELGEEPVMVEAWDLYRAKGLSPSRVVASLKVGALMGLGLTRDSATADPTKFELVRRALSQMDHPDFLRYVAAKMGAI